MDDLHGLLAAEAFLGSLLHGGGFAAAGAAFEDEVLADGAVCQGISEKGDKALARVCSQKEAVCDSWRISLLKKSFTPFYAAACRRCHTALPRWVIERRLAAFAARQRKAPLAAACRRCHAGGIAGQRKAPLVQRGDSMAKPCRGDCKARQMIQLGVVIGCGSTAWPSRHGTGSTAWERRLAVNPSVGVRRQLPLHKGGPVAGRPYCLCLGRLC